MMGCVGDNRLLIARLNFELISGTVLCLKLGVRLPAIRPDLSYLDFILKPDDTPGELAGIGVALVRPWTRRVSASA